MSPFRVLLNLAGDWLYAVLVTFGWQPREEREKPAPAAAERP